MTTAAIFESLSTTRPFETRYGSRVAIVGGGILGTALALRYRQAGRIVTLFDAAERPDRRGHATVAATDRHLLALVDELGLTSTLHWNARSLFGSRLGALSVGRAGIIDGLRERARMLDVDLRLGTAVHTVETSGGGFIVETGNGTGEYDQVLLTVPGPQAAEITPILTHDERRKLHDVQYVGIVSVSFVLERPLGGRYLTRVVRGGDALTVVDPSAVEPLTERSRVVYVCRAVAAGSPLFFEDDRGVIEHFVRALPGNAHIVSARVNRTPHAFAGRSLASSFVSSVPGLAVVTAAHHSPGRNHLERTAALATSVFRTLCSERIAVAS